MKISDLKTQELFSKAYILGGSPCSGKSTIAKRLSFDFGLQYYKVDDHEGEHAARCDPKRHPTMARYNKMSWDEIWMRPIEQQVEEEFSYYRERFEMISEDLKSYSLERPLVVEGAAYLPELLEINAVDSQRVAFFVPSEGFQLHHYRKRPWIRQILQECGNPGCAFDNWMKRDHMFGREILEQAKARNFTAFLIDGKRNIDAVYKEVKTHFGFE